MKSYIIIVVMLWGITAHANNSQIVKGIVKDKSNPELPIVGANIYWENTMQGTTSDSEGVFEIAHLHGQYPLLVVSFVGYKSDTIHVGHNQTSLTVFLEKNIDLDEVVVSKRRQGQYHSTLSTIQTTKVTTAELQKAACCNLSESFETNASVDVSFTDAVTGAKQIKMLGLSGVYVQTISENMPLIRGMAAPYGLGHVPGPWLESIQISKGTSSVVNGYEAIAGQINVEYKKPQGNEVLHLNLYGNNELKTEANLNYAYKINDQLSTMILLHGENHSKAVDDNGDSFLDMPHIQQINFVNRWNYIPKNGGHREIGIKVLDEHIQTGQVGAFDNPTENRYGIDILTRRYEVFAKNGILFNKPGTSLGIQASGSYHNQESVYGLKEFSGTQFNGYLNMIYMGNFGSDLHTYKTGVSYLADSYDETLEGNPFNFNEMVTGAFVEYSYDLHSKLNVMAGLRADYSNIHNLFVTPRLHVRWNVNDHIVWRTSVGKGYRTALPLAENSYLLASSREIVIDQNLKQEEAVNAGSSITTKVHLAGKELTMMVDFYHTNFINQVVRDVDSDVHRVRFMNLDGRSYSNAIQAEMFYELFRGFTLNAAYRVNDVKQTINGELREMPLTSRYKGMVSMSYATRMNKWQFDFTSQFNGGGRMPDPSTINPLWEATFDPYTLFNAQITKNFKRWSFYLGSENLSDFKMHNPIIASNDPWGNNFDGSMIWGPVHGRKIYLGLRYTINNF
jgi:outer membrane receptor for ferrienterochelin and colicins